MAYATLDDLERGWRTMSSAEAVTAAELLNRAATWLDSVMSGTGLPLNPKAMRDVSCNVVQRVMINKGSDLIGAQQSTMTAGSYSQTVNYGTNLVGTFYLTKADRQTLGLDKGFKGAAMPSGWLYD